MLSDEKLLHEINRGNEAAVEILVQRHYSAVFGYICRKTGNHHRADDLTQEVFIKMLKGINKISANEGKFINWLLKIAVNTCRDYYKSSWHARSKGECELDESLRSPDNVISIIERKERLAEVKEALSRLPEEQREAVVLKFFHEKKFSEIAEITDSNESTVKSRVRHGLMKLKSILGREDEKNAKNVGNKRL